MYLAVSPDLDRFRCKALMRQLAISMLIAMPENKGIIIESGKRGRVAMLRRRRYSGMFANEFS